MCECFNGSDGLLSFPPIVEANQTWRSCFFFSSRRRHTILVSDWSSDVCSSDLLFLALRGEPPGLGGCQFDQGFNRCPCAVGGIGLDDLAKQHEEGNHACLLVMTGSEDRKSVV